MPRLLAIFLLLAVVLSSGNAAEIFGRGSQWKYRKGTSEASSPASQWRQNGFNDSSWSTGNSPFYYGEGLSGTALDDMRYSYTSVFMRKTFSIANPSGISELELEAYGDDGFIVWINGNEVARYNMPLGDIAYDATSLGPLPEPIPYERYVISGVSEFLVPGSNVIAVHGFNTSLSDSSDFVFDASLSAMVDTFPPIIKTTVPLDRALVRTLNSIEVIFSENVSGVDASDLLINGTPATSVSSFGADQYVFEFTPPPTGAVQVAFAPNHGIADLAPDENAFGGGSWSYTFDPNAPLPGVIISEFMADNDNTINDENGDPSDWIELFNAGETTESLNGWFLTDSAGNLTKWRIPNVSLSPNSYLLIFASDKNRTNPAARLHTNFKLSNNSGGYLALVDSDTNIVSEFVNYPAQEEDISYGRERSNPSVLGFFPTPTPGDPNTVGGAGFSPEVLFSRSGGTFTTDFDLALSTGLGSPVIHYELGTNMPSETSPVYTGPIRISATTQVRARSFQPGLLPGKPKSEIYMELSGPVLNFTSDLPLIILHNYGGGSVPASYDQFVMMEVFEPKNGVASLTNAPDLVVRARFKLRGSSTEGYQKRSFAFEAWDEYGDDFKIPMLGMPEESDWVFYAPNNFEPILIHNPFTYQLSREVGRYASRTRFAEVFLNTSGGVVQQANYNGIYVVEEKIKRGKDRVDVDKLEPEHLNAPEVTGGYMLKIDRSDPGDSPFSGGGQSVNFVDPKGEEIRTPARDAQEQYIRNYLNQMGNSLRNIDPVNGYAKYLDVPSWIDHHLINLLTFNVDALRLSTYFYKPRNEKVEFGPVWDFDRALGSTDGRDSNPRVWANNGGTDFFNYPWWGELFQDLEFWQKYIDRWQELRRKEFSNTNMFRLIGDLTNQVRKAYPRELARWGVQPRGGSYEAEVNYTKNWLQNRVEWIDGQFLRAPIASRTPGFVTPGTTVTLQAAAGSTIYYTLNGTDPRARGGGISAGAKVYTGPITVSTNVRIFARARNLNHSNTTGYLSPPLSSVWSGYIANTYMVETPQLTITEIMYHPGPVPAGGIVYTNSDYEFIELKNIGEKPINLAGAEIQDGVHFEFTSGTLNAGERILVVKNRTVFESRYGTSLRIAGEFTGSLDNLGERLVLVGPYKEPILDFSYSPEWYPITDGLGFSLVLTDEDAAFDSYGLKSTWNSSAAVHGSPAATEPARPSIAGVVVNEALTHTDLPEVDWVELLNPTAGEVDIGNWYLSDDFFTPKKYRISAGTKIAAGGFVQFTENEFNQGANSFSFGSDGDDVFLFSANAAGDLTGYYHGFGFDGAANGVTFGRHVTSDGLDHFVAQISPTPNGVNAGPRIGPVVINEIMFHPPGAGTEDNEVDEFIEVANLTGQSVPLFDATVPTNTWRLRGGSDFEFPENVTLAGNSRALVVNFDPSTNATFTSAFRTRYGIAGGVPIFGPFRGKLSNTGERLSLQRPDNPDGSSVPYIAVDEVRYSSVAPWPGEASSTGKSYQRLGLEFANEPLSWTSADPTAGAATVIANNPDRDGDGLPNEWETAHELDPDDPSGENGADGDPDEDGLGNLEEYVSGTDPQDNGSTLVIEAIVSDGSNRVLTFTAMPEKSYSIFYRTSLTEGTWIKLSDIPASPTGGTEEIEDDNAGEAARFYRLVTPQQ